MASVENLKGGRIQLLISIGMSAVTIFRAFAVFASPIVDSTAISDECSLVQKRWSVMVVSQSCETQRGMCLGGMNLPQHLTEDGASDVIDVH